MVRPFFKNRPPLAEVVAEHGPGRRLDPRVYFHDGDTPYAEQSSGVPAQVKIPLLFFSYRVGRAVIKDLSLGGVGFLAPTRLSLPDHVCLHLIRRRDNPKPDLVYVPLGRSTEQILHTFGQP